MLKSIIFIEFNPSHTECIYAAIAYLKAKFSEIEIYIAVHTSRKSEFEKISEIKEVFSCDVENEDFLPNLKMFWALRKFIVRRKIQHIFFNTAHGSLVRNFSYFLAGMRVEQYGLLHNSEKFLRNSITQHIITWRIKHYFALAEYVVRKVSPYCYKPISSYYATRFPLSVWETLSVVEKPAGQLWIAIPGGIELKRRSYEALVEVLNKNDFPNLYFLLLGNASHSSSQLSQLKKMANFPLEKYFIVFHDYIPFQQYYAYVQASDFVLPLIHPHLKITEQYLNTQISGAFNAAWAFRKPLLMHEKFNQIEDFQDTALFYNEESFAELLQQLSENELQNDMYKLKKWDFDCQAEAFCKVFFE